MGILAKILFLLGALPTVGGIAILVALAPKPKGAKAHLLGVARYLMVTGGALAAARVLMGWTPSWDVAVLMLGLGLGMGIYARENHLLAKLQEKLDDGQESGV